MKPQWFSHGSKSRALVPTVLKEATPWETEGAICEVPALDSLSKLEQDDVFVEEREIEKTMSAVKRVDAEALVKDEYRALRDVEVKRRLETLHHLLHPNPSDYLYNGRQVPPPPISFGQFPPASFELGYRLLCEKPFSLVRSAVSGDYFFEINDYYLEIAFVGRANSGKSSLLNALTLQSVAKTSSAPNSTRKVNFYQSVSPAELSAAADDNPNKLVKLPGAGLQLTLVDVPGYGVPGMSSSWKDSAIACTDAYLGVRRSVNTVFMCVNALQGFTKTDAIYLEWMQNVHGVVWVLVTQADRVSHDHLCNVMRKIYRHITRFRSKHQRVYPYVLPVSAMTGANIDVLRALIVETSGIVAASKVRANLSKKSFQHLITRTSNPRLASGEDHPEFDDELHRLIEDLEVSSPGRQSVSSPYRREGLVGHLGIPDKQRTCRDPARDTQSKSSSITRCSSAAMQKHSVLDDLSRLADRKAERTDSKGKKCRGTTFQFTEQETSLFARALKVSPSAPWLVTPEQLREEGEKTSIDNADSPSALQLQLEQAYRKKSRLPDDRDMSEMSGQMQALIKDAWTRRVGYKALPPGKLRKYGEPLRRRSNIKGL